MSKSNKLIDINSSIYVLPNTDLFILKKLYISKLIGVDNKFLLILDKENVLSTSKNTFYFYDIHSQQKLDKVLVNILFDYNKKVIDKFFNKEYVEEILKHSLNIKKKIDFSKLNENILEYYNTEHKKYLKYNLQDYKLKAFDTYFELSSKDTSNYGLNIISLFEDIVKYMKDDYDVCGMCLQDIDDYKLRKNFNGENIDDLLFKFVRPFVNYNKPLTLDKKELGMYEKQFYNKKFFISGSESNNTTIDKDTILNMKKNSILLIRGDIKIIFNIKKDSNNLEGYYNTFDKNILKEIYDKVFYLNNNFIFNKDNIKETKIINFKLSGNLIFDEKLMNINEDLVIAFFNLSKINNEKLFIKETLLNNYERRNSVLFYLLKDMELFDWLGDKNILIEGNNTIDKQHLSNYITSVKKDVNSLLSSKKFIELTTGEIDDTKLSKNIIKNYLKSNNQASFEREMYEMKENFNTINYFKFVKEFVNGKTENNINFFCSNYDELNGMIYTVQLLLNKFIMEYKEVLRDIIELFGEGNEEVLYSTGSDDIMYPTSFKKLVLLKEYGSKILYSRDDSIKINKSDITKYSNTCLCDKQPIILFNEKEKEDWLKISGISVDRMYENEGLSFVCLDNSMMPSYDKKGKYLCCKKKNKEDGNYINPQTQVNKDVKQNIISSLKKDELGIIPDDFMRILKGLFGDDSFNRKGSDKTYEDFCSEGYNTFLLGTNNNRNSLISSEVYTYYPLKYNIDIKNKENVVLMCTNGSIDYLVKKDEGDIFRFNNSTISDTLKNIFDEYNKEIYVDDTSKTISISNTSLTKKSEEVNKTLNNTFDMGIQLIMYKLIVDKMNRKFDGLNNWIKGNINFVKDSDASNTLILSQYNEWLKEYYFVFVFNIEKNELKYSYPRITEKIMVCKSYNMKIFNMLTHIENNIKNIFENYFFVLLKNEISFFKKNFSVRIPVSKNFLDDVEYNLYDDLNEYFIHLNKKNFEGLCEINDSNKIFTSDNVNTILPNNFHKYNLFFSSDDYNTSQKYFSNRLYGYIVRLTKNDVYIKMKHPRELLSYNNKCKNYVVYEFNKCFNDIEVVLKNIVKGENNEYMNIIIAPFNVENNIKIGYNEDFIDFYVRKNKMIFIPFEFYLNRT